MNKTIFIVYFVWHHITPLIWWSEETLCKLPQSTIYMKVVNAINDQQCYKCHSAIQVIVNL